MAKRVITDGPIISVSWRAEVGWQRVYATETDALAYELGYTNGMVGIEPPVRGAYLDGAQDYELERDTSEMRSVAAWEDKHRSGFGV